MSTPAERPGPDDASATSPVTDGPVRDAQSVDEEREEREAKGTAGED